MQAITTRLKYWSSQQPQLFLVLAAVTWLVLYRALTPISEMLVTLSPLARDSRLGDALQFFLYDKPKVLLVFRGTAVYRLFAGWCTVGCDLFFPDRRPHGE